MNDVITETELEMEQAIETYQKRLLNIRAGRANPSILDGVMVSYYGVDTPLKQLATISIPEARQLMIKPFDRSCLQPIEKGIYEANVGLTPNNNGETIILNQIAEEAKIQLRNIRQDANHNIKQTEDLTEDDKESLQEDVQELINKFNKKVDEIYKEKENELMTV